MAFPAFLADSLLIHLRYPGPGATVASVTAPPKVPVTVGVPR